jgi:DNA-directed RNA polymerase subunit M/transcription elongation factor TFIIS
MHTKIKNKWDKSMSICPYCKEDKLFYMELKSSCGEYEDTKYKCFSCKKYWWIDGIDS